jgi:hypothetical protein
MNRLFHLKVIFVLFTVLKVTFVNGSDQKMIFETLTSTDSIECDGNCAKCHILLKNNETVNRVCQIKHLSKNLTKERCCQIWNHFKCLINFAIPFCPNYWKDFESGIWNKTAKLNSTKCKPYPYGSHKCTNSAFITTRFEFILFIIITFNILFAFINKYQIFT